MADVAKIPNAKLVRLEKGNLESEADFFRQWTTPLMPPQHIVFIDVPATWDLSTLVPRADRHIAQLDKETLTANLTKWSKKPKVNTFKSVALTKGQMRSLLVSGKLGLTFHPKAADMMLELRGRNLQSLYWPVQQLIDMNLPQPITLDDMMGHWPIRDEVDAHDIKLSIGTTRACILAYKTQPKKAWGGLFILEKMIKNPLYLEYLDLAKQGIVSKRWSPKMALILFTMACLHESTATEIFGQ
jgi:hypothetical protein